MDLVRIADPAALFADLSLIKAHLRLNNAASDTILSHIRDVATEFLDGRFGYLRRALVTQDWRLTFPDWPYEGCIYLPLPPLQSVQSVKYYDTANVLQTLAGSQYQVLATGFRGRIERVLGVTWPAVYDRPDAVQIEFRCGFGTAAQVPTPIKQAALLYIAMLFAQRGDVSGGGQTFASVAPDDTQQRLLARYRVVEFT